MADIYIALLRADGTEPEAESGYHRANIGSHDISEFPDFFTGRQIPFPDVMDPGYGTIAAVAACDSPDGGSILKEWNLPQALDCHAGVVPVIYNGHLYRGMEVRAAINMNSADLFGGM